MSHIYARSVAYDLVGRRRALGENETDPLELFGLAGEVRASGLLPETREKDLYHFQEHPAQRRSEQSPVSRR